MAKLNCLHISDLHIGESKYDDNIEELAYKIFEDLKENDMVIDVVIVSGDIFYGRSSDNEKEINIGRALNFFNTLKNLLNKLNKDIELTTDDFIFTPGNHDIIREDNKDIYPYYRDFLKKFYKEQDKLFYDEKKFYTIRVYEKQKVAIVGLNSCMIKRENIQDKEIKWVNKLDLNGVDIPLEVKTDIVNQIKTCVRKDTESKWDDYGEIKKAQIIDAFDKLENMTEQRTSDYRIITTFHHHFYPFPETYDKYGDRAIIRNFSEVIDSFVKNKVKIILHGHKHVQLHKPITTNKYFTNPDTIMYVFSTGALGCKRSENMSFQVVEAYSPDEYLTAKIHKYSYTLTEKQVSEPILIPPRKHERGEFIELLDVLQNEDGELFKSYSELNESDHVSQGYKVDEIIKNISRTITKFEHVRNKLKKSPNIIYRILLSIHLRIVALHKIRNKKNVDKLLGLIKEKLKENIGNDQYCNKLFSFLLSKNNNTFQKEHKEIIEKHYKFKTMSSFITISTYFTDLYLTLTQYGEFYYKNEKIEHKINIKLAQNIFHINLPVTTIKIESNEDRRTSIVQFKCKDPTVHKIAVLIVKDFEDRINKIEDSFKEVGLKIYYVRPKVSKDGYEMDNYNFEAYIPTLLPLLTGDNLYKQKEVFIRELLQNSLDAILLREKLDNNDFDRTIYIEFGEDKDSKGKNRRYLKIKDHGIGMDIFKIERYFTSIGRSFYVSDEFNELQEDKSIAYKPVSNFGIGFLSAFMVCKEIKVKTKSYHANSEALEINIPNYEGCFFINKRADYNDTGTEIILYEDDRKLLNGKKIIDYIENVIKDFQLNIKIKGAREKVIDAFKYKKTRSSNILFIPFEENGLKEIPYEEILNKKFLEYPFGLVVDIGYEFTHRFDDYIEILNSGIKLLGSRNLLLKFKELLEPCQVKMTYCFPASYIQLDVAREEIVRFKSKDFLKEKVFVNKLKELLFKQAIQYVKSIRNNGSELRIRQLNYVYDFFQKNMPSRNGLKEIYNKLFALKFSFKKNIISIKYVSVNNIDKDKESFYLLPSVGHSISEIFRVRELMKKFETVIKGTNNDVGRVINKVDKVFGYKFRKVIDDFALELELELRKDHGRKFTDKFKDLFEDLFERVPYKLLIVKEQKHLLRNRTRSKDRFIKIFEAELSNIKDDKTIQEITQNFTKLFGVDFKSTCSKNNFKYQMLFIVIFTSLWELEKISDTKFDDNRLIILLILFYNLYSSIFQIRNIEE